MAQAQITLKMNPVEFQVFQEAMLQYPTGLDGDDQGTRYRKSYAQGMLSGMGVGVMPEIKNNGQLRFNERGRVYGYQPDLEEDESDDEPNVVWTDFEAGLNANAAEEEEAPEAETQVEIEEVVEEAAAVEELTVEAETTEVQEVTEAQGEPVEVA